MEAIAPFETDTCLSLHAVVDPNGSEQIDDPALLLVRHRDLVCVTRLVPASEYANSVAESSDDQLAWLTPRALHHHELLLKLMRFTTVVPLKFGTLCARVTDVEAMLHDNYQKFRQLIELVRSREEWSVNVYVNKDAALRRLEASEPTLRQFDEMALMRPDGEAYLLRKQKQKLANELLTARFATLEQHLYSRLEQCVGDIAQLEKSSIRSGDCRKILVNVAVLIPHGAVTTLEQELAAIELDHAEDNLTAEMSGPWPAYNFKEPFVTDSDKSISLS